MNSVEDQGTWVLDCNLSETQTATFYKSEGIVIFQPRKGILAGWLSLQYHAKAVPFLLFFSMVLQVVISVTHSFQGLPELEKNRVIAGSCLFCHDPMVHLSELKAQAFPGVRATF